MQQQSDWTPPNNPAPNAPNQSFNQPPSAAGGGQNQTLAIVSLVLGILSLFCCGWFVPGIVAAVLGFIAKGKAESNPAEYGGRGFALGGIITGGVSILLGIIVVILYMMGMFAGMIQGM